CTLKSSPDMFVDQLFETNLAVILRRVTNDFAGIGDAPEGVGVIADAVKNLEWHAKLVADVRRLYAFDEQLRHIPLAEIHSQSAPHPPQIAQWRVGNIRFARSTDPNLHIFQRPAVDLADGEHEPEVFVYFFGPAVKIIRQRPIIRIHEIPLA